MKVVLKEDVANLGKSGEVVEVKKGFGRNFLIPRNMAVEASRKNLRQLEHEKRLIGDEQKKRLSKAERLKEELEAHSPAIQCQVGEQDRLFGAVTARDIADQLRRDGFNVDRKQIQLEEPLKQLGIFNVPVKVGEGLQATIKLWLVPK